MKQIFFPHKTMQEFFADRPRVVVFVVCIVYSLALIAMSPFAVKERTAWHITSTLSGGSLGPLWDTVFDTALLVVVAVFFVPVVIYTMQYRSLMGRIVERVLLVLLILVLLLTLFVYIEFTIGVQWFLG